MGKSVGSLADLKGHRLTTNTRGTFTPRQLQVIVNLKCHRVGTEEASIVALIRMMEAGWIGELVKPLHGGNRRLIREVEEEKAEEVGGHTSTMKVPQVRARRRSIAAGRDRLVGVAESMEHLLVLADIEIDSARENSPLLSMECGICCVVRS